MTQRKKTVKTDKNKKEMKKKTEFKSVPQSALRMNIGKFELGDNGEGAKSAPVKLKALGGKIIDHWYFGPIIQDLSGMEHSSRIAIDYNHDPEQIIGYANKFSTEDGELVLSGALVPYKESDRASEIIHKLGAGVPYQASIQYTPTKPDQIQMEEVAEGVAVAVNGKELYGPLTVVRKWTLGGVAITPYGADSDTAAFLQNKQNAQEVTIMTVENAKTEEIEDKEQFEQAKAEAKESKAVEAEPAKEEKESVDAEPEAKEEVEQKEEAEPSNTDKSNRVDYVPETKISTAQALLSNYSERFGQEKAIKYIVAGLEMKQAAKQYTDDIVEENKALRQALKSNVAETVEPAEFDSKEAPVEHSFTRKQIAEMSQSEYKQNRSLILEAAKEGKIK